MTVGLKKALKTVPFLPGLVRSARTVLEYGDYVRDYRRFRRIVPESDSRFRLTWRTRYPCLGDKTAGTPFDRHYVYHPAWAARILAKARPAEHVDVSSSLHFVSIVSAFIPVKFYDYRPADLQLEGLSCERGDLMRLPFPDQSVASLSCMHVVEHIGLGRYGDPLDPDGDLKAMRELARVLAPGGNLLFVVPVGRPMLQFNAHRIYAYDQVVEAFGDLVLEEFTLVPEVAGPPIVGATREDVARERYACGCFWFRRAQ